jgi:glycosyltransferase involved in cell wall biosynthesis
MDGWPKVSIICTSYNHENYIAQALDGFVMQKTSFPFEIIVHDDASKDNSAAIIKKYEEKYPNLFSNIYQTENQYSKGNGDVGSIVFSAARGEYIAICEGDDFWTDPYKLEKQVTFLDTHNDYGLVWTDVDFFSQSSGSFKRSVFRNKIQTIYNSFEQILINKPFFAPPTWLFRREFLPKEVNNYCDGTFPMILDIIAVTKIKYMDEVTATYRQLDESASSSKSSLKRYKFLNGVYRIQKDYIKKYKLPGKIEEEVDFEYYKAAFPYAVFLKDVPTIEKGRSFLENCFRNDPKVKVILFLSHFSVGAFILKIIYNNKFLKSFAANLSIFK